MNSRGAIIIPILLVVLVFAIASVIVLYRILDFSGAPEGSPASESKELEGQSPPTSEPPLELQIVEESIAHPVEPLLESGEAGEQVIEPPVIQTAEEPVSYTVKPYLVYPADKLQYASYETAVRQYLNEVQSWYEDRVGATFAMEPLKVVQSSRSYLEMRCGENPSVACSDDPSKLEGNWAHYMNEAIHSGVVTYYDGGPSWSANTVELVFGAGGGGYAGANSRGINGGWAVVGDWVLEPISGVSNEWGIPCLYSDGWQCSGGVPKGTLAHELGHTFGLPHPGEEYADQTIMEWHGNFPEPGLLPSEIDFLRSSPFFL